MKIFKRLIFLFFLLLFIPVVYAEELNISSVSVKDKSGTITYDEIKQENNTITSNITFHQLHDFLTLDVEIDNQENNSYILDSITSSNSNYLVVDYDTNQVLKEKNKGHFYVTLKYDKELINQEELRLNDLKLDFHYHINQNMVNPNTKNPLLFFGIIFIFIISFFMIQKRKKTLFFFSLIFLPLFVFAVDEKTVSLSFSNLLIKGRLLNYTVIVDHGNGEVEEITKPYGDKVGDLPIPEKEGYTFLKWIDEESSSEINPDLLVEKDMRIVAQYNPISYNITYNLDGGVISTSNPSSYTIESNDFTLNNPEKTGYSFSGWTLDGSSELQTSVTIFKGSTGDKTYTAHYSPNHNTNYKVIHQQQNLDGNGYKTIEIQYLTGTTDSSVTPQRKSYEGFTAPAGQTKTIKGDGSTTFTYQYTRNQYTFQVSDRTYVTGTSNGTYYYGTSINITAQERAGYTFKWSDGKTSLTNSFPLKGNTTLTANYTANTNTPYKVIHKKQNITGTGYDVVSTLNLTGTTDSTITPTVNTYEGFTSPSSKTVTIKGDGTTEVVYEYIRNKYTLTLTDAEYITTTTPTGEYYYETSITLTAKEREKYTFIKWSDDETSSVYTFSLTQDKTIGPVYEKDKIIITFHPNGGEVTPTTKEIEDGQAIGSLPEPTREDYNFVGWYTALTGGIEITSNSTFEESTIIYARWEQIPILYNVLKYEAEDGGLAKKYTEEHKDSFTEDPSKDIYHWYAKNDTEGTEVLNKNNVIFANQCWQMIRTTDTGGVKMIYNGEAENEQCLNTRGTHVGYSSLSSQNLASSYWYGTDYTYDSVANTFKVSGTTEQVTWNATTGPGLIGKYTCKNTSVSGTCTTLYLVESYKDATKANVIPLNSNSHYSQFGTLQFNASSNSPTYVGYMYGDVYENSSITSTISQSFTTQAANAFSNTSSFEDTYLYSNTITFDGTNYILDNPILGSEIQEATFAGYYTFESDSVVSGANPLYLVGASYSTRYHYIKLSPTRNLSYYNLLIADSITDNLDGTYTLDNPSTISPVDWYNNYTNYNNKYSCNDSSATCTDPIYFTNTNTWTNQYIKVNEKIMIGKTRSGLTLTDTLLVRKDELVINSSNYSDYKYTCNTDSATCTESTLRMITGYSTTGYNYAPNHYWGSSVTWDGTNYTLQDPIGIENYNNVNNISTHHYMCVSEGLMTCATVAYAYYYTGSGTMYYITLKNGVTTVDKALEDMLTKNTTKSIMKSGVDAWYKHSLLEDYDDYIEDTIFCNKRVVSNFAGWNDYGNVRVATLEFETVGLNCSNETDKFSLSNTKARLTYKVGLMSSQEMSIMNNKNAMKTGQSYWLFSPSIISGQFASNKSVYPTGYINNQYLSYTIGVRPSISLRPGIEYSDGDGSMENPYMIETRE